MEKTIPETLFEQIDFENFTIIQALEFQKNHNLDLETFVNNIAVKMIFQVSPFLFFSFYKGQRSPYLHPFAL